MGDEGGFVDASQRACRPVCTLTGPAHLISCCPALLLSTAIQACCHRPGRATRDGWPGAMRATRLCQPSPSFPTFAACLPCRRRGARPVPGPIATLPPR